MPSPDLNWRLVRYPDAVPYEDRQQRDRDADQRGPDEEPDEAGVLDHEAREPRKNAAGKGAERGQQAELASRMLHRRERRHVSDEHDRRESVSKALDTDRQREGPERLAAVTTMCRKEGKREMRGRARDRADEEARHHADARDQPPGHEGSSQRDPETEDLGDGRDVGVCEALVLE